MTSESFEYNAKFMINVVAVKHTIIVYKYYVAIKEILTTKLKTKCKKLGRWQI